VFRLTLGEQFALAIGRKVVGSALRAGIFPLIAQASARTLHC
jgi:hypothetical protein